MDLALVIEVPAGLGLEAPDHSAAGLGGWRLGLGCDVEGPKLVLLSTLPVGVGVAFLGSVDTDVGTGFKTWASGLVV